MYGSHCNPSTPENDVRSTSTSDVAPLTLVAVDPDHHWVNPADFAPDLFWTHEPPVYFFVMGR